MIWRSEIFGASEVSRSFIKRLLSRNDGAAAVEFAIALPTLMIAVIGIIEFGQAFWAQNALHYAVEQTARCMTLKGSNCNTTEAAQNYAAAASGYNFAPSVFTPQSGVACGTGVGNQVNATYPFQFNVYIYSYNLSLTAQSCFPSITN